jgi:hypothetical protein
MNRYAQRRFRDRFELDTARSESSQPSQPPGSLLDIFRYSEKCRHSRGLAGNRSVSGEENPTFQVVGRIFLEESLLREFSISEIGQVVGPETGCVLTETGSNVAWLDVNLIKAGKLVARASRRSPGYGGAPTHPPARRGIGPSTSATAETTYRSRPPAFPETIPGSILTGNRRHRGAPAGLLRGKIQERSPTRGPRAGVAFTKSWQRIVPISAKSKTAIVPAAGKQL